MSEVTQLIQAAEKLGAHLRLEGEKVMVSLPKDDSPDLAEVLDKLRRHKNQVRRLLLDRPRRAALSPDTQPVGYMDRFHDPYWQATSKALLRVRELALPPGTLPRLHENYPALYQRLVKVIPDHIDHLWNLRAPLR